MNFSFVKDSFLKQNISFINLTKTREHFDKIKTLYSVRINFKMKISFLRFFILALVTYTEQQQQQQQQRKKKHSH
jgi:hypothetical protein